MIFSKITLMQMEQRLGRQYLSDQGLFDYVFILGLGLDQLEGKRILDLGGGATNAFVQEALMLLGASVTAINLNPMLGYPEVIREKGIILSEQINSVAGEASSMPFADNSFDLVLSMAAFPKFFTRNEFPGVANEIWRILDNSGVSLSWPYTYIGNEGLPGPKCDSRYVDLIDMPAHAAAKLRPELADYTSIFRISKPVQGHLPNTVVWL